MKKYLIILSVLLNVAALLFATNHLYFKYKSVQKNRTKIVSKITYAQNRDLLFKALPKDKNEIIFLGDSHTQKFPLDEIFKNPNIKNRGIDGDVVKGIYLRLDEITGVSPSKVFIMGGINDINNDYSIDSVVYYYSLIIDKIKTTCQPLFCIFKVCFRYLIKIITIILIKV